MSVDSRDRIRRQYARIGRKYDDHRIRNPKGLLLGDHDIGVFERLLPEYREGMQVLEVGAGTGRFTLPALRKGFRLTATDINEVMLDMLRSRIRDDCFGDRCDVRTGDIFDLSFPSNHFDFVFSLHVIPRFLNLQDQRAALLELARVTKLGGTLLVNYRNTPSLYCFSYREHATRPSQLKSMLDAGGMRITKVRTKHVLNRTLLDRLPLSCGRILSVLDRTCERVLPGLGWDVFLTAVKETFGDG